MAATVTPLPVGAIGGDGGDILNPPDLYSWAGKGSEDLLGPKSMGLGSISFPQNPQWLVTSWGRESTAKSSIESYGFSTPTPPVDLDPVLCFDFKNTNVEDACLHKNAIKWY